MITDITLETNNYKLHTPFVTALRRVEEIETVTVRIQTDSHLEGIGAASPTWQITGDSLASIKEAIMGPIRSKLLNQNESSPEMLSTLIKTSCIGNYSAKAAVDIAAYDLFSKKVNTPLHHYLGGYRNKMTTDMTLSIDAPEEMVKKAEELITKGFHAFKIKIGGSFEEDFARIKMLRTQVPENIVLRIDANQHWAPKEAVKFINRLEAEELNIELVEQPVQASDIQGLTYVTNNVTTPIMADESLFSTRDALTLLQSKSCDMFNIKLMKTGGIREALAIADIAEAAGIECMMGSMMESPISVAAAVHLACGHRNITRIDMDAPLWLEDASSVQGITYDKNIISCSEQPGIGI